MPTELQKEFGQGTDIPQRLFYQRPIDTGAFVLPIKQSFIKDARLMPGTRCMLTLLVGWAGQGRALELTKGRIARHLGRSVRQVYRYLKDAAREGYLSYNYTKNRMGMIVGIKVFLNFSILRSYRKNKGEKPRIPDWTQKSNTKRNLFNSSYKDEKLDAVLARFERSLNEKLE